MEVKPIRPGEVDTVSRIPGFIFKAVNHLISKNYSSTSKRATVKQKEIVEYIKEINPNQSVREIYDNKWLDIEDAYRKFGWKVTYDKPAYCETYDASFEFIAKE